MQLYQPESGYCYNSDSLFLYDFIDKLQPKGKVLEVGPGCGVIGLLVARDNHRVSLEAIEKQEAFVQYAQKNAEVNKIEYKITQGDFLEYTPDKEYEYIISNPPFYHEGVSKSENVMRHTARYNIHLPLEPFFKKVDALLKPQGHFVFCYEPSQFALISNALAMTKLRIIDVQFVHSKRTRKASLVMIHARKNSKSLLTIMEPFFSFDGDAFSDQAKAVYTKSRTNSIKCQL